MGGGCVPSPPHGLVVATYSLPSPFDLERRGVPRGRRCFGWHLFGALFRCSDLHRCGACVAVVLFDAALEQAGAMPLPPYIASKRAADEQDKEDYQTVFAKHRGSVAAPTASLHFDEGLLDALIAKGVDITYVTLHVGAGTFLYTRPARSNLEPWQGQKKPPFQSEPSVPTSAGTKSGLNKGEHPR